MLALPALPSRPESPINQPKNLSKQEEKNNGLHSRIFSKGSAEEIQQNQHFLDLFKQKKGKAAILQFAIRTFVQENYNFLTDIEIYQNIVEKVQKKYQKKSEFSQKHFDKIFEQFNLIQEKYIEKQKSSHLFDQVRESSTLSNINCYEY